MTDIPVLLPWWGWLLSGFWFGMSLCIGRYASMGSQMPYRAFAAGFIVWPIIALVTLVGGVCSLFWKAK